ncbi:MAG: protein translocase subunit SecF [Candidatus Roseilinea sp.]|uniref:protein translocase subunit SecF n=1 Tax=Candidatus Roseilinea sp. TaxID=2838777 RepID=UPI00404A7D4B
MLFSIVQNRRYAFAFSLVVILAGVIAMLYNVVTSPTNSPWRLGVDFREGSRFVLKFNGPVTEDSLRAAFVAFGLNNPSVSRLGAPEENLWQVRTTFLAGEQNEVLLASIAESVGPLDRAQSSVDSVSPQVAREVANAAVVAVLAAVVAILLFIWYSFRKMPHPFRYSLCAILALIHDILVTGGAMALFSAILGWEADVLFLTAMLTVVGFSIQDTIVVFDRIRENLPRYRGEPFHQIVSRSLVQTVHRSIVTSLTNVFVTTALLLFGGNSIRQFVAILLVGLIAGTYSSIFVAVPALVAWEERSLLGKRRTTPHALPAG